VDVESLSELSYDTAGGHHTPGHGHGHSHLDTPIASVRSRSSSAPTNGNYDLHDEEDDLLDHDRGREREQGYEIRARRALSFSFAKAKRIGLTSLSVSDSMAPHETSSPSRLPTYNYDMPRAVGDYDRDDRGRDRDHMDRDTDRDSEAAAGEGTEGFYTAGRTVANGAAVVGTDTDTELVNRGATRRPSRHSGTCAGLGGPALGSTHHQNDHSNHIRLSHRRSRDIGGRIGPVFQGRRRLATDALDLFLIVKFRRIFFEVVRLVSR
jgi:hypothetical protein